MHIPFVIAFSCIFGFWMFNPYLLSRPPPEGLPVVLGIPPLPFDLFIKGLFVAPIIRAWELGAVQYSTLFCND